MHSHIWVRSDIWEKNTSIQIHTITPPILDPQIQTTSHPSISTRILANIRTRLGFNRRHLVVGNCACENADICYTFSS